MIVQVSLCLFGVNEVKVNKKKIIYYIVLERAQGPTLLDCNHADTWFTVALGSVLAGCYTQVPHRSTLRQQPAHMLREGVKGLRLRRWLGDIVTAVSYCRGWKGQKTMPSGGKVDDTHAPD